MMDFCAPENLETIYTPTSMSTSTFLSISINIYPTNIYKIGIQIKLLQV